MSRRSPAELYETLPVRPDECGHVGTMVYRERSCRCSTCGQTWVLRMRRDDTGAETDVPERWAPAGIT